MDALAYLAWLQSPFLSGERMLVLWIGLLMVGIGVAALGYILLEGRSHERR